MRPIDPPYNLLTTHDREIVIARTTAACDAQYDVLTFGDAVPEQDRLLVNAIDELLDAATLSDSTRSALGDRYSDAQVIELVLLTGWYRSIATLINAARLPLDPAAPRGAAGSTY
ncbi:hypothetical protein ACFTSF_21150 [Kribbella sp. NPDC056951]|uniref:hypothetical protein n=1 Tax=Kribbella sp. NPDC056951 TaxID=3345978 RepID=UPI0036366CBF